MQTVIVHITMETPSLDRKGRDRVIFVTFFLSYTHASALADTSSNHQNF